MTTIVRWIYKIENLGAWDAAVVVGHYSGSADDLRDGFIHFSTAEQAPVTAARHFTGRSNLVVAAVEAAACGVALHWEPSRGGALFPHLYKPLAMALVNWTKPLPLGPDGLHVFPAEMI